MKGMARKEERGEKMDGEAKSRAQTRAEEKSSAEGEWSAAGAT